jgi:cytochrome c oxidase subunit 2
VPNELGQFEVNCSQLCGLGHYRMRGFVTVMEQADYDAWLAEEASFLTGN